MDKLGWFALIMLAILMFLVLNNWKGSVGVINALGGNATALTGALQGRGVTGAGTGSVGVAAPAMQS